MDTQMNGSTALATIPASTALEPQSLNEALIIAGHLARSGVLGTALTRPEAALAVIMAGRELGLTAMQSLRSLHVIEGKVTLSSDAMLALVKRSPQCRYFRLVESTATIATYETERVGEGVTRMSFSIEDAKRAKLLDRGKDPSNNNWNKYPAAMLRARCIAALARAVYPDTLMGVYETDEIELRSTAMESTATFVVEPATEAQQSAAEDKARQYLAEIAEAKTLPDLQSIAARIKTEPKPIRDAVRPTYDERKKAIEAAPIEDEVVTREPGSDDE